MSPHCLVFVAATIILPLIHRIGDVFQNHGTNCQFLALLQRGGVWKEPGNNWMIPYSQVTV